VLDLLTRTRLQHFFDDGPVVCATLDAGVLGGRESELLATAALNHDALGMPPVDFAHLYMLKLIVSFNTLNHFRHLLSSFPSTRLLSARTGDTFSLAKKDLVMPKGPECPRRLPF
jgi:hypothetical protein